MRRALMRGVRVVCLTSLVLCMVDGASASGGREFAASDVSENKGVVQPTIALHLQNYSGAGITSWSTVPHSSSANRTVHGSFSAPQLLHKSRQITMSHAVSIPKAEYQLWEEGRDPAFCVFFEDVNRAMRTQQIGLQPIKPGVGAMKQRSPVATIKETT